MAQIKFKEENYIYTYYIIVCIYIYTKMKKRKHISQTVWLTLLCVAGCTNLSQDLTYFIIAGFITLMYNVDDS